MVLVLQSGPFQTSQAAVPAPANNTEALGALLYWLLKSGWKLKN